MQLYRKAIFASVLLVSQIASAAVSPDTLVWMNRERKQIVDCLEGDHIIATDFDSFVLSSLDKVYLGYLDSCIEITLEDTTTLTLSSSQRVLRPQETHWVEAKEIKADDYLCAMGGKVKVVSAQPCNAQTPMYSVEVKNYHNFFAGKRGVLLHNGPICAGLTYWGIKAGAYLGIAAGTAGTAVAASGLVVASAPVAGAAAGAGALMGMGTAGAGTVAVTTAVGAGTAAAGGTTAAAGAAIAASTQSIAIYTAAAASIETAAGSAALWVFACPFLP